MPFLNRVGMDDHDGGGEEEDGGGGRYRGGRGRGRGAPFQRSPGNAKMPFPNYLQSHSYAGPWSNDPQVGSLVEALRKKQRGAGDKPGAEIYTDGRKEYGYLEHPVLLLREKIEPAAASQRTVEKADALKHSSEKRRVLREIRDGASINDDDDIEPPRPGDRPKNDFETGNVAFLGIEKNDKPRLYVFTFSPSSTGDLTCSFAAITTS
jgi:hypothetical protein